jgi:hypothetical protein
MLNAGTLYHGGIMVNYQCPAACRHCLYACSPTRGDGYISREMMGEVCRLLRQGGIGSVHIGGGEPFLNFEGLLMAIRELKAAGITLDYIETNAAWVNDDKDTVKKLKALIAEDVSALCISVDPFHAEYIPYALPLRLAHICDETGMDYFLWKQQFLKTLSRLDPDNAHSRAEMEEILMPEYISNTAGLYGLHWGGRAVNIEEEYAPAIPAAQILNDDPCHTLLSTGHFHVDMDGFFIPPGCTGIRLPLAEAVDSIPDGKYPVFESLYHGGTAALIKLAKEHGFVPKQAYPSRCNLCFHTRRFLSSKGFAELDSRHYEESVKYY